MQPSDNTDALLRAVHDEVIAYGVRRATATSIAARAGVSRMTVHRRGGGVKRLIMEALTSEFERTVRSVAVPETGSALDRMSIMVVQAVRALAAAPLTAALLQHDPDLLVPYWVERLGRGQLEMRQQLEEAIRAGQVDGSIRTVDPHLAATVTLHALQDFVISSRILAAEASWSDLTGELNRLVRGYLAA